MVFIFNILYYGKNATGFKFKVAWNYVYLEVWILGKEIVNWRWFG